MTTDGFGAVSPRGTGRQRVRGADVLLLAAAVLIPLGVLVILLGWYGAAHTPYLFEQVPYLISGGLVGLAFVLAGGLAYFGAWIARGVAGQQRSSDEIAALLREIRDELGTRPAPPGPARRGTTARASDGRQGLVATAAGSMLHRPDCTVMTGRDDARPVTTTAGLTPCGLCNPLSTAPV